LFPEIKLAIISGKVIIKTIQKKRAL